MSALLLTLSLYKIRMFLFLAISSSINICQHNLKHFLLCRLTAFIVKVLTRSKAYINIQDSHIHDSISYLINAQQEDGSFHDHHPVLDRTMQVGHHI